MRNFTLFSLISLGLAACGGSNDTSHATNMTDYPAIEVQIPETKKDTTIKDDYHGTMVADPYRWLEDDNSEDTKAWVIAQNSATNGYLSKIPFKEAIRQRLEKIWNFERYGAPFKEGGKYYYFKNDGLQNQSVLYVQNALTEEATVVLDPNSFSKDGTVALGGLDFNKEGNLLAYQISEGGSDWQTILVKDLKTGQLLEDRIEWVKFSGIAWHGNGFYYSRYPAPKDGKALSGKNENQAVYFHEMGSPQSKDRLVFSDKANPQRGFSASTTKDERFLVISAWESTSGSMVSLKDLSKPDAGFKAVSKDFTSDYSLVDNVGDDVLFLTNNGAGNQRLIKVSSLNTDEANWTTLLPETKDVISGVDLMGGKIFATYMHNASSQVKIFDTTGKAIGEMTLPGIGTLSGFSGKMEEKEAFYGFSSYTRPNSIFQLNTDQMTSTVFKAPTVDFNSDEYITEQLWFESKDGTKVPMFVTHKKNLPKDGIRPTLLYGYGGFDISLTPSFSVSRTAILENDGIFAVVNLRGGGEFGKEWHMSGTKERKQNVFDDFQAAAKYLIDNKYTNPKQLAIEGGSNGGLLIGACMTQRPDLYAVAFPRVGVLDMLRYHKFTIGAAWASDYGTSETPEGFAYLYKYSPVHNTKPANYPATMVMTADHDDRVVPAHSFKFAAALQAAQTGEAPTLIRIETSAGHGAGKPTSKLIEEAADMLSFFFYNTNAPVKYTETKK